MAHADTLRSLYDAMEADDVPDAVLAHLRHALDALGDDTLLTDKERGEKWRASQHARLARMMGPTPAPRAYTILSVDWSECLQSYPCQHRCRVRWQDGTEMTTLLNAPDIKERFVWKMH